MVTGKRINGIQSDYPGHAVVPVPEILPVRIGGTDDIRPINPDLAYNFLSEFSGIFQPLIRITQKDYIHHPQQPGGIPLFLFADFD